MIFYLVRGASASFGENCPFTHYSRGFPIAFKLNDFGQKMSTLRKVFENPKMFVWTLRMQFWQPYQKISRKIRKLFAPSPKSNSNFKFYRKKISRGVPLDSWNAVLVALPKTFGHNSKNVHKNINSSHQKFVCQKEKKLDWTCRFQFWQP